jgi:DNA-binding protein
MFEIGLWCAGSERKALLKVRERKGTFRREIEKRTEAFLVSFNDNIVFIGIKETSKYLLAVHTQFNQLNQTEVILKARGRAMNKAIDIAQILKNRSTQRIKITGVEIGTEEIEIENGDLLGVSTIEIRLKRDTNGEMD